VPRLVYTKMIWDETLRLYPPAWLLHARKSRAEDKLPSGVFLPTGTRVFQSPWSMHRNPRWFPNPGQFDPDRFLPEAKQARPAFSYFPFGGGGRRCVGESSDDLEAKGPGPHDRRISRYSRSPSHDSLNESETNA
jgi:cytochrome P450